MTIEFWIGSNFPTSHERKALKDFLDSAYQIFSPRREPYFILSNYYLGGRQIDLTIIKPEAILVADLKDCAEPFRAMENGLWQILGSKDSIGTGIENPYQQVKELRNIWIDYLSEREDIIHKVSKLALRKFVQGAVVISSDLNPATENKIPHSVVWFHLYGLLSLPNEFLSLSCPAVKLEPKDIQTLIREHLHLTPGELSTGLVFEPLSRTERVATTPGIIAGPQPGFGTILSQKPAVKSKALVEITTSEDLVKEPIPSQLKSSAPPAGIQDKQKKATVPTKEPFSCLLVGLLISLGVLLLGFSCSVVFYAFALQLTNQGIGLPLDPKQRQTEMLQNTKIAYVFDGNIYTMTPYGSNQTQLTFYTHGERSADELSWSPDGKKIAFDAVSNGQWDIFVLDIASKEIQPLVQTLEEEGSPSWSPDGKYVYYSANRDGNQDIYRISHSGGTEERMTEYPSSEYDPAISMDGKKILFVSNMNGNWDVYRLVLSNGNLLRVSRDEGTHINPRWRPGHNEITYFTIGVFFDLDEFFWVDSDSLKSDFTNGWGSGNNPQYDWSPDGSMLVKSEQSLCIYGIDFQEITGLACGIDGAIRPAWSPILKR
jgi:hypothetical protein